MPYTLVSRVGIHREVRRVFRAFLHSEEGGSTHRCVNEALEDYLDYLDGLHSSPDLLLDELLQLYGVVCPCGRRLFGVKCTAKCEPVNLNIRRDIFERLKPYILGYGLEYTALVNASLKRYLSRFDPSISSLSLVERRADRLFKKRSKMYNVAVSSGIRDLLILGALRMRERVREICEVCDVPYTAIVKEAINRYSGFFEGLDPRGKLHEIIATNNSIIHTRKVDIFTDPSRINWALASKYNLRKNRLMERAIAWYLRDLNPEPYEIHSRIAQMILEGKLRI